LSTIDAVLTVALLVFALRGYFKGLFREIFSSLGLFAGSVAAVRYAETLSALWKSSWKTSPIVVKALTIVLIFFAVYLAFSLIGWILNRLAPSLFLQGFNRMGGIFLGAAKGSLILGFIFFFLLSSPLIPEIAKLKIQESYLALPLQRFAHWLLKTGTDYVSAYSNGSKRKASVSL